MKNKHEPTNPSNIGKQVFFNGREWTIIGINWLGSYDIERFENRPDGRYRIESTCVLGLPADHGHYAYLFEVDS